MEIPVGTPAEIAGLINALSVGDKCCFIFNNIYFSASLDSQNNKFLVKAIPCGEDSAESVNYEPGEVTRLVTGVYCDDTYPYQIQPFEEEVAGSLSKQAIISCDGVYNGVPTIIVEI